MPIAMSGSKSRTAVPLSSSIRLATGSARDGRTLLLLLLCERGASAEGAMDGSISLCGGHRRRRRRRRRRRKKEKKGKKHDNAQQLSAAEQQQQQLQQTAGGSAAMGTERVRWCARTPPCYETAFLPRPTPHPRTVDGGRREDSDEIATENAPRLNSKRRASNLALILARER